MAPSQKSRPDRVTAKAGAPTLAKKKPWMEPIRAPPTMAARMASHSFTPWVTARTATIAPDTPLTEPTERSISPSSSTKMMPMAIMPVPVIVIAMLVRFSGERKFEFSPWKIDQMTIRPMTTGREPRSPAFILRLNSPTYPARPSSRTSRRGSTAGIASCAAAGLTGSTWPLSSGSVAGFWVLTCRPPRCGPPGGSRRCPWHR